MKGETAYLRSLCDVSRAFASAERKDQLLNRIIESAIDTMGAKAACLFLEDEGKGVFLPVAQKGLSKNYLHAEPESARALVPKMRKQGYIHIRDAASDPRSENREIKAAEGIASILAVPVQVNRPIGVLALYTAKPRDFSEIDICFLTALAEQGGIAIHRARLIDQLRNNASIFHDLAAGINSSLEIPEIMRMLTQGVTRALNARAASVRLIDSEANALRLVSSYGLSETYLNKGSVDEDRGIPEALAGESTVVHNAAVDDGVDYRTEKSAEGIVSIVTVPIRAKSDMIGVLRVYYGTARSFFSDELIMVQAIGYQAGLGIQNASIYMKLESEMKDLQSDIWSHRSWF